jgi:hypothetical protein
MEIVERCLRFSTGRVAYANRCVVGIGPTLELTGGYDGDWWDANLDANSQDALSPAERVELADHMIARWQTYRSRALAARPHKTTPAGH